MERNPADTLDEQNRRGAAAVSGSVMNITCGFEADLTSTAGTRRRLADTAPYKAHTETDRVSIAKGHNQ